MLSAELLADIELSRVVLMVAALKAGRLARLLNDFDHQQIFRYEAGGYDDTPSGISPDVWRLARMAGRTYEEKDPLRLRSHSPVKTSRTGGEYLLRCAPSPAHLLRAKKLTGVRLVSAGLSRTY